MLLLSLLLVLGGSLRTAHGLAREGVDPIAPYLFACAFTWTACGVIENQVTDRYLYVPIAAIAACALQARGRTKEPA